MLRVVPRIGMLMVVVTTSVAPVGAQKTEDTAEEVVLRRVPGEGDGRSFDEDCGLCTSGPVGNAHSFFGGSCTGGPQCWKCAQKEGSDEEADPCHFEFQPGVCSEHHDSCEPTEEQLEDLMAARDDAQAIFRLIAAEKDQLIFNAERRAIQAFCGARVSTHLALNPAVADQLSVMASGSRE